MNNKCGTHSAFFIAGYTEYIGEEPEKLVSGDALLGKGWLKLVSPRPRVRIALCLIYVPLGLCGVCGLETKHETKVGRTVLDSWQDIVGSDCGDVQERKLKNWFWEDFVEKKKMNKSFQNDYRLCGFPQSAEVFKMITAFANSRKSRKFQNGSHLCGFSQSAQVSK